MYEESLHMPLIVRTDRAALRLGARATVQGRPAGTPGQKMAPAMGSSVSTAELAP